MDPTAPIYRLGSKQQVAVYAVASVSAALVVATLAVVIYILLTHPIHGQAIVVGLTAFWVIWPPLWFFFEYFWLYRSAAAPDSFELFKHGQQAAIAIWAGISLTLSGLVASDFLKPAELALVCTSTAKAGSASEVFVCHQTPQDKAEPIK